nr:PREDICTED: leucine-rich repeat and WD repeat-containing protein 1-like [Bemisia tabaci]
MDFDPMLFFRCHSCQSDPEPGADTSTQVWYCDFMPDPKNPSQNSNFVATVGGQAICIIDLKEMKVWKNFYCNKSSPKEEFFCSVWINVPYNEFDSALLLVAGSNRGKLYFLSMDQDYSAGEISVVVPPKKGRKKDGIAVNSVCVHIDEKKKETLLCGLSCGLVFAYDMQCATKQVEQKTLIEVQAKSLGSFSLPTQKVAGSFSAPAQVLQLVFCPTTQFILIASDTGLYGVHMPSCDQIASNKHKIFKFQRPDEYRKGEHDLSDSVQVIGDSLISVKYALHGAIFIFDLNHCTMNNNEKEPTMDFVPRYVLEWSNTDNYFLNIGVSRAANLLACGDDQGTIWVYDIKSVKSGKKSDKPIVLPPTAQIAWPDEVIDRDATKKKKLDLKDNEIVINKVTIHSSGQYIVAATNKNTVCLWKRNDDTVNAVKFKETPNKALRSPKSRIV